MHTSTDHISCSTYVGHKSAFDFLSPGIPISEHWQGLVEGLSKALWHGDKLKESAETVRVQKCAKFWREIHVIHSSQNHCGIRQILAGFARSFLVSDFSSFAMGKTLLINN